MEQIFLSLKTIFLGIVHQVSPQGCIVIAIIAFMLFFISKLQAPRKNKKTKTEKTIAIKPANNEAYFTHQQDIQAIAGEDEVTTQLDLARAYIEMEQTDLAKEILQNVITNGNTTQQSQAKQLITELG